MKPDSRTIKLLCGLLLFFVVMTAARPWQGIRLNDKQNLIDPPAAGDTLAKDPDTELDSAFQMSLQPERIVLSRQAIDTLTVKILRQDSTRRVMTDSSEKLAKEIGELAKEIQKKQAEVEQRQKRLATIDKLNKLLVRQNKEKAPGYYNPEDNPRP